MYTIKMEFGKIGDANYDRCAIEEAVMMDAIIEAGLMRWMGWTYETFITPDGELYNIQNWNEKEG